ncbi:pseudouridine synthase [Chakrabartyella piscis]|uniref:pseudouridine synthase n=1 Tax=Chakrabartyella piscis TaxID=2918914 RepID=UPI002958CA73|nr:pseudouridine synthase [Chakrabartyella piscis]
MMRLDKFLTLASLGRRKKMKELIYGGHITVNGTVALLPDMPVHPDVDVIVYDGTVLQIQKVYYVFHKPQGCITARSGSEKTVLDYFTDVDTTSLFAVGRLDKDTEGLLFLTNDGDFDHRLMKPEYHVEKTYHFLSIGEISDAEIEALQSGVDVGYKDVTKPAKIKILQRGTYEELVQDIGRHKVKHSKRGYQNKKAFLGEIILEEGKKNQVKRMLRHVHCPVIYLKRVAIGGFVLSEDLAVGKYHNVELLEFEQNILKK